MLIDLCGQYRKPMSKRKNRQRHIKKTIYIWPRCLKSALYRDQQCTRQSVSLWYTKVPNTVSLYQSNNKAIGQSRNYTDRRTDKRTERQMNKTDIVISGSHPGILYFVHGDGEGGGGGNICSNFERRRQLMLG